MKYLYVVIAIWIYHSTIVFAQNGSIRLGTNASVVVFLAEGCPICEQSTPELNRLSRLYTPRGVAFYAVFPNDFSDSTSVAEFAKKYKISMPLLRDTAQTLVGLLGARVTPQAFVLKANGSTVYSGRVNNLFVGLGKRRTAATVHDLEDALKSVLQGVEPMVKQTQAVGCVIERRESVSAAR